MKPLDLSFISVNYNGKEDTMEMIASIISHVHSISYEIIVVDNASKDKHEITLIKEAFPMVITVRSEENLGFAGGSNLGINISRGNNIMLINNDTLILDDNFDKLISKMGKTMEFPINNLSTISSRKKIGAISPKIIFKHPDNTIQFAGYTPLSKITLRNSIIGYMEPNDGRYSSPYWTPYCHGAAMIVSREALLQAGEMTEKYFLYYEELDWSIQLRKAGFGLLYDPSCFIIHKESQSVGNDSALKTFYMTRNRLIFATRNLKGVYKTLSIVYQKFISIPKNIIVNQIKGRSEIVKAIYNGLKSYKNGNKYKI